MLPKIPQLQIPFQLRRAQLHKVTIVNSWMRRLLPLTNADEACLSVTFMHAQKPLEIFTTSPTLILRTLP